MKKGILLSVCALLSGCMLAMAVPAGLQGAKKIKPAKLPGVPAMESPVYNPEGTDEAWIMNVTENTFWGDEDIDGYKMAIRRSADGKTIWFRDLTPGFNGDANTEGYSWVMGTVEGNDITIPAGQVLYKTDIQQLYLEVVTVDEWGQVQDFLDEVHFTIDGDRIYQADNSLRVSVFDDAPTMEEAGFFIFMNNFDMMPIGDVADFTPPAGVEVEKWMMTCNTGSRFVNVARDGNTVYVSGLSSMAPDDYVPGTLENGVLTFKSAYILTSHSTRYLRLIGAQEGAPNEWGYPQLEMTASYSFDVNDDCTHFTLNPAENYIVEASYFNFNMLNGINNVEIFRYAGDVAATPASPVIEEWSDYDQLLRVTVPCEDVDGNFINPELLTYRIYLDGEVHTLSPDEYYALAEDMTDIPYNFTDQYDIYSNGDLKTIFLHAPEFNTLEVESTYTVDGEARTSARAVYAGIDAVNVNASPVVSESYTDLLGRRVAAPSAGSMLIKTSVHADGTVSTAKVIVR